LCGLSPTPRFPLFRFSLRGSFRTSLNIQHPSFLSGPFIFPPSPRRFHNLPPFAFIPCPATLFRTSTSSLSRDSLIRTLAHTTFLLLTSPGAFVSSTFFLLTSHLVASFPLSRKSGRVIFRGTDPCRRHLILRNVFDEDGVSSVVLPIGGPSVSLPFHSTFFFPHSAGTECGTVPGRSPHPPNPPNPHPHQADNAGALQPHSLRWYAAPLHRTSLYQLPHPPRTLMARFPANPAPPILVSYS